MKNFLKFESNSKLKMSLMLKKCVYAIIILFSIIFFESCKENNLLENYDEGSQTKVQLDNLVSKYHLKKVDNKNSRLTKENVLIFKSIEDADKFFAVMFKGVTSRGNRITGQDSIKIGNGKFILAKQTDFTLNNETNEFFSTTDCPPYSFECEGYGSGDIPVRTAVNCSASLGAFLGVGYFSLYLNVPLAFDYWEKAKTLMNPAIGTSSISGATLGMTYTSNLGTVSPGGGNKSFTFNGYGGLQVGVPMIGGNLNFYTANVSYSGTVNYSYWNMSAYAN